MLAYFEYNTITPTYAVNQSFIRTIKKYPLAEMTSGLQYVPKT